MEQCSLIWNTQVKNYIYRSMAGQVSFSWQCSKCLNTYLSLWLGLTDCFLDWHGNFRCIKNRKLALIYNENALFHSPNVLVGFNIVLAAAASRIPYNGWLFSWVSHALCRRVLIELQLISLKVIMVFGTQLWKMQTVFLVSLWLWLNSYCWMLLCWHKHLV